MIVCWLDAHSELITALATVVIGIFTVTIWRVASQQLKQNRDTERAYLFPSGLMNGNTKGFIVRVANNGKTPGELTHVCATFCEDSAIPPEPKYEWAVRRRPFAPGEKEVDVFESAPVPSHFNRALVYGAIKYLDVWNKEHICGFVLRLDVPNLSVSSDIPDGMNPLFLVRS